MVAIRAARANDAEALHQVRRTPQSIQFISRLAPSVQDARALVEKQRADDHAVRCVIEVDGRVVGDIEGRFYRPESLELVPLVWDFHIGYAVHPDLWGHGIATAAVGLFTPLLHEAFGVRRVAAKVFEDNVASAVVLRRAGYRHEGTEIATVLGRDGTWLNDCTFAHLV